MKVATPAMKLDVRINDVRAEDGLLVLDGVAGVLPCKTSLTPAGLRQMRWRGLRPKVLALLLRR